MARTRIHEFEAPIAEDGYPTIEIKELTAGEFGDIAEQASRQNPLNIVAGTVLESKLKRLACIRGYTTYAAGGPGQGKTPADRWHVADGHKPHDILAAMSVRAQSFLDMAIDHVHEVRASEAEPFFGTRKTTEV